VEETINALAEIIDIQPKTANASNASRRSEEFRIHPDPQPD
jgi:hypothetical protein